jgi:DNA-binding transcriptional LysR family regulator
MEMHQVRYFLAAADALSFTRAAEVCHVSQPALTTAIRKLEEHLGSTLFHREGRQISLTEFGRRMQPHLSQIADQLRQPKGWPKIFAYLNRCRFDLA